MARGWLTTLSVVLLALVLVATLSGCASGGASKGEMIVYVAVPLSGWQADGGQTVVGGVKLAADEINRQGGLQGYRLKVVPLDDEADSDVAVDVANQIAAEVKAGKKVLGVVGHYNSGQSAAALKVYRDLPILVVTPTASDPALTAQGYTNFFRVNATDAAQGPYDAAFLVNELKAQRIVVVYAENDYGKGLKAEMVKALQGLGRPAVAEISIPEAADTQAAAVIKIKAANPDAVFLAGYETEGYVLLPELREAGVQVPFMASDGCFLFEFVDGSGPWAEGVYVSGITPDPKVVANKEWWKSYQTIEARNPGTYSIAGYSAMTIMAAGVNQAKSLDLTAIKQALRQSEFATLVGPIRYDDKGDMKDQRVYIFQVRGGEFVQVKPSK
jgi:branched-chain amino acid transport system substrate-binding protein